MKKAVQIDSKDNVATLTSGMSVEETVQVLSPDGKTVAEIRVFEEVPFGHKISLAEVAPGDRVIKYGETIGLASRPIRTGEWVHVHNVESAAVPTSALRRVGV